MKTDSTPDDSQNTGMVLGRIPSGIFVLIAGNAQGQTTGMLASWVQQAAFQPPQVTVAVNKSRYFNDWLQPDAPVTLNQLAKGDTGLLKHFGKGFEPDADAFSGVETIAAANGLPLLTGAMASLEGRIDRALESGDHMIYLMTVTRAFCNRDLTTTEPYIHLRRNGFNY